MKRKPPPHGSLANTKLAGKLLIAMPNLLGSDFERSVIYICQHDEDSTMGLILNHPIGGLSLGLMLDELGIEVDESRDEDNMFSSMSIFRGGPVQDDRGFVLHSLDYFLDDITLPLIITDPPKEDHPDVLGLGLTASRDILIDLTKGKGPKKSLIALGFAGWGAGQIEDEIKQNVWLVAPSSLDIIFETNPHNIWTKALKKIGVEANNLSASYGNA